MMACLFGGDPGDLGAALDLVIQPPRLATCRHEPAADEEYESSAGARSAPLTFTLRSVSLSLRSAAMTQAPHS
jgi:hypothetical protein